MTVDALQLEKLDAREGDLFVMRVPGHVSQEQADNLRKQWDRHMPGTKVLVLGDGFKLELVRVMRAMVAGDLGVADE